MDSVIFQAMAVELHHKLAGSRLDKVVQASAGTLVLKLWTGKEKVQLMIKAEGKGAFYLTRGSYTAPARPPRICQLLRARLRRLIAVQAEPLDRIVHLEFSGPDNANYDLILEAFGSQGNLILVDETGRIVDLLFRQEGKRQLMPGETYQLPEQKGWVALLGETTFVVNALQAAEGKGDFSYANIAPMSPALAHVIRLARLSGQSYEAIVTRIKDAFQAGAFLAQKISIDGSSQILPLSLNVADHNPEEFEDLSSLVEKTLTEEPEESAKDLSRRMSEVIRKQRKRLAKRQEHIAAERGRQSDPDQFRIMGELLLANMHKLKRGDLVAEVENFYLSPSTTMSIELDSKATPHENAERYFKLYRKAKRSGEHHARRLEETEQEIAWLEDVEMALEESESGEDLYQVQVELEAAGMLKKTKGQLGKRQPIRTEDQLYQSVTPGGWQLYWGKNSRTNDYVSRNMTGPQDLWFHAKGMPGSHLVLKCGDSADKVSDLDLHHAASLAAGYSKGKDDTKVEVIVAQGRDVKKPKGARPGLVTVDSYQTVMVAPARLAE